MISFIITPALAFQLNTAGTTPQLITNQVIADTIPTIPSTRTRVYEASVKYNVPFSELWGTIGCETNGTYDPTIQSLAKRPDGTREKSYGLAQIYLVAHPEVTYEQATDAEFSIDFIARNWKKHKAWWSCFNNNKWIQYSD